MADVLILNGSIISDPTERASERASKVGKELASEGGPKTERREEGASVPPGGAVNLFDAHCC